MKYDKDYKYKGYTIRRRKRFGEWKYIVVDPNGEYATEYTNGNTNIRTLDLAKWRINYLIEEEAEASYECSDKYFLIQEFETAEARDKALDKVSDEITCYFSENTGGYYNSSKWVFVC